MVRNRLDNKPFIAVDANNSCFHYHLSEDFRVIEFTSNGKFIRAWSDFGTENTNFGLASGVDVDANGDVWVTDVGNNRILKY